MRRSDLLPDCGSCAAVCCVATSYEPSDDFASGKAAGVRCRYLRGDCRCAIHDQLALRGFSGCAIYDCHGAGQRATRAFSCEEQRNAAFLVLREVHELLWLLTEAAKLCPTSRPEVAAQLAQAIAELDAIADGTQILDLDLLPYRATARALLPRVGAARGGRLTIAGRGSI